METQRSQRIALGNKKVLSDVQLETRRKSVYINSTYNLFFNSAQFLMITAAPSRNSDEAPQWMLSTSQYYRKPNNTQTTQGIFKVVRQANVYSDILTDRNKSSHFHRVRRLQRPRNKWELADHTFRFEWPQKQETIAADQLATVKFPSASQHGRAEPMGKYATTFRSPLYRQKPTAVKIGHNYMINSTYVK